MRLLVICAIVAAAAPAWADDTLETARRLEGSLEYEQGLAMVERLLVQGGATLERVAELHLLAGRLAAGLDRLEVAEDHFARLLAIRPDAMLPEGTSPKLTGPFAAARARSSPLSVVVTLGTTEVTYAPADPLGLIAGIELEIEVAGARSVIREPHALKIALPEHATVREERALDAAGNVVWLHSRVEPVIVPVVPPPAERPSIFGRWPTWAIVTGVALAAGGISAWRFSVDQRDWNRERAEDGQHDFSQLQALEARGRQWGLAADLGFGVAGAAALTTVIVWLAHRGEPPVTVTASPGGVGIAGHF